MSTPDETPLSRLRQFWGDLGHALNKIDHDLAQEAEEADEVAE